MNLAVGFKLPPTYDLFPRHFSLNSASSLLAAGNQNSGNVAMLSRDVATGLIGDVLAAMELEGQITTVGFNEVGAVNGA